MRIRLLLVLTGALLVLSGCGVVRNLATKRAIERREKEQKEAAEKAEKSGGDRLNRVVGSISYVHAGPHVRPEEQYVLIRPVAGTVLPPGTVLECRRAAATPARIVVTSERISPYLAADVISGEPARGDHLVPAKDAKPQDRRLVPVAGESPAGTSGDPGSQDIPELPPLEPLPEFSPSANPGILTEDDILGPRESRPPPAGPQGRAAPDR